jgi:hypothetical protein
LVLASSSAATIAPERLYHLETHNLRLVLGSLRLQSTIPRLHQNATDKLNLEILGAPEWKFFLWLITQNRLWSDDQLGDPGWPHNNSCILCRQCMETTHHLLANCRYVKRIWELIAAWTTQFGLSPSNWTPTHDALQWWTMITTLPDSPRRALRSLTLAVILEIWKERNTQNFDRCKWSTTTLFAKIRSEVSTWIIAGAKDLVFLVLREYLLVL